MVDETDVLELYQVVTILADKEMPVLVGATGMVIEVAKNTKFGNPYLVATGYVDGEKWEWEKRWYKRKELGFDRAAWETLSEDSH